MKRITIVIGALIGGAFAQPAPAQLFTPELRPFVGAYVPTGSQRDLFKDATMFGVQGALELAPTLHLVGTYGWVPAHNKYSGFDENVSIFSYDIGAEFGVSQPLGSGWEMKPFLGLGVGARSYVYKSDGLSDRTCGAGYGSLGSEFQLDRVALRLEARDNVFCYRSPIAGVSSRTRNDVGLSFGFAYHFR
jgi:hypothetical protein